LTDTGAYTLSRSPYGTFDQGGNVWEWNETVFEVPFRGTRGGSWVIWSDYLHALVWSAISPTNEDDAVGFRVATIRPVPEPATGLLLFFAAISCLVAGRSLA
jgi:formylglycine-generating enzyme required for sulfatase activity